MLPGHSAQAVAIIGYLDLVNEESLIAEAGRLSEAAPDAGVPIDLIVVSADTQSVGDRFPGTLMHEALRDGHVIAGT
jgi:hypothetical protein